MGRPDYVYISNQHQFPSSPSPSIPQTLTVHVLGEVTKPGLYKLPLGARIIDGIKAGGEATEKADLDQLNLAAKLVDGKRLYVPPKENSKHEEEYKESNKIDINRASVEQLQTLPSIGPAIAKRIIDYRLANGRFETIEQLKEVKGIGEKTFEKIKDRIAVDSTK